MSYKSGWLKFIIIYYMHKSNFLLCLNLQFRHSFHFVTFACDCYFFPSSAFQIYVVQTFWRDIFFFQLKQIIKVQYKSARRVRRLRISAILLHEMQFVAEFNCTKIIVHKFKNALTRCKFHEIGNFNSCTLFLI